MKTNETRTPKRGELDLPALGRRIRESRERQRWSQRKLGAEVALRPERLSRLESGALAHPRLEEIARLARALGKRLDELVYGVETAPCGQLPAEGRDA